MFLHSKKIKQAEFFLLLNAMKDIKETNPETVSKLLSLLCHKVKGLEKAVKGKNASKGKKMMCSSSLRKGELAFIFYILMDEGILYFDEINPSRNRSLLQLFFESNFGYRGDGGKQMPLHGISREFSESKGFTYREKQLRMLDEIINRLECRKLRIK